MKCPHCKTEEMEQTSEASELTRHNKKVVVEYYCNRCQEYFIWTKGEGTPKKRGG